MEKTPEKYYGFNFFGADGKTELVRTFLPLGELALDELLYAAKGYAHNRSFKALFGTIKELTIVENDIKMNSPSKVGGEKLQAFILKRNGDAVTGEGNDYFVNDEKLDLGFESYNVTTVEI